MDAVLGYWQDLGVDGFRCDFAHLVPIEAWRWLIDRARERDPDVYFFAEAYQTGQAVPGFSFSNMVQAGFDAVYDDASYDTVKSIFCCGKWANDLEEQLPGDFMFDKTLRYAENHDERRIASPLVEGSNPDDSGFGSYEAGKSVSALLYLLGSGPYPGLQRPDGRRACRRRRRIQRRRRTYDDLRLLDDASRRRVGERPQLRRRAARRRPKAASGVVRQRHRIVSAAGIRLRKYLRPAGLRTPTVTATPAANRYFRSCATTSRDAAWLVVANLSEQQHATAIKLPREMLEFLEIPPEEGTTRHASARRVGRLHRGRKPVDQLAGDGHLHPGTHDTGLSTRVDTMNHRIAHLLMRLVTLAVIASARWRWGSCRDVQPIQEGQDIDTHVDDWRDEVIYQILVDRFENGDPNNDLSGQSARAGGAITAATGRASSTDSTTSRSSA